MHRRWPIRLAQLALLMGIYLAAGKLAHVLAEIDGEVGLAVRLVGGDRAAWHLLEDLRRGDRLARVESLRCD